MDWGYRASQAAESLPGEIVRRGISETGMSGWEMGAVLLRPEVLFALVR